MLYGRPVIYEMYRPYVGLICASVHTCGPISASFTYYKWADYERVNIVTEIIHLTSQHMATLNSSTVYS